MPKKKDATKDGVSETDDKQTPASLGHSSAVEAIAENVKKQHFEEAGVTEEETETETEQEAEEETAEETKPSETEDKDKKTEKQDADSEPSTDTETKTTEMVKLVVDGEEKEVPLSEVIDAGTRTLQKGSAADKRLKEATDLLNEAKKTATAQPSKKDVDTEAETETETEDLDSETVDFDKLEGKLVHAIQYGEDDDVKAAVREFREAISKNGGKASGADVNEEVIVANVLSAIEGKTIIEKFKSPKDRGGFKDLTDNPRAYDLVRQEIDKMLEDGEPNKWETYQKAGTEIRKFLGWEKEETPAKTKETKNETDPKLKDKQERKKEIDTIETAAAAKESTSEEEETKTPSDTIDEMRRSRPGQII